MAVKNVLTIDLDFLCKDVRAYNSCIPFEMMSDYDNLKEDPELLWNATGAVYKAKYGKDVDTSILKGTDDFIFSIIEKNPDAEHLVLTDHNEILGILNPDNVNHVVNIDFHHDMGYQFETDQSTGELNNWVVFGWDDGKIASYSWIGRSTSAQPTVATIPFEYAEWRDVIVDKLPKFDIVAIVKSPEFTTKEVYNAVATRYNSIEGFSRKVFMDYCKDLGYDKEV